MSVAAQNAAAHSTPQKVCDLHVELYTVVTRACLFAGRGLPEQRTSLNYCGSRTIARRRYVPPRARMLDG
jgi:hypothetical protein